MAERDQFRRLLGAHDAGKLRHRQHVAFLDAAFHDLLKRFRLHVDAALGSGGALGIGLIRHVDHDRVAVRVDAPESTADLLQRAAAEVLRQEGLVLPHLLAPLLAGHFPFVVRVQRFEELAQLLQALGSFPKWRFALDATLTREFQYYYYFPLFYVLDLLL